MSTYFEIKGRKDLSFNQLIRDVDEEKFKNILIDTSNGPIDNSICLMYKTPRAKIPKNWLWVFRSGKTIDFESYGDNNPEIILDAICAYYRMDNLDEYDERYIGIEYYDIKEGKALNFDQLIRDVTEGEINNIVLDETVGSAEFVNNDEVCLSYKTPRAKISRLWIVVHRSGNTIDFRRYGPKGSEIILDAICAFYKLEYTEHIDN